MKVVLVVFMFVVSAFAGKIFGPVPSLRNGIGGKIVGGQEADIHGKFLGKQKKTTYMGFLIHKI